MSRPTDAVEPFTARATVVKAHAQALINAAGLAFAAGELTSDAAPAIGGSIDGQR